MTVAELPKLKMLKKINHYYWREEITGRIVVSDESADYGRGGVGHPANTDDGMLFLHTQKLKDLNFDEGLARFLPPKGNYRIPLLTPEGEMANTTGDLKELLYAIKLSKE